MLRETCPLCLVNVVLMVLERKLEQGWKTEQFQHRAGINSGEYLFIKTNNAKHR